MDRTISVTVTEDDARALSESVEAGEFASPEAALRDALRVWRRDRDEHAQTIASIKQRIQASLDDPRPRLTIDEVRKSVAEEIEGYRTARREAS